MKLIIILFILLITMNFTASVAWGSRDHTTVNHYTNYHNSEKASGTALAIATANHTFYWGVKKTQASIAVGQYDGESAVSIGIGKRFDGLLINGSIGSEDNKVGYGAGFNWHF